MLLLIVALTMLAVAWTPIAAVAQDMSAWRPQLVANDESDDRNIPNFRFDAHHTAGGHYMITDTNWQHYAPLLGIDLGVWPNAMSAPEQLQGQVAGRMWAETGYMPWVCCNARLRHDLSAPHGSPRVGFVRVRKGEGPAAAAPEVKKHDINVFPDEEPGDSGEFFRTTAGETHE